MAGKTKATQPPGRLCGEKGVLQNSRKNPHGILAGGIIAQGWEGCQFGTGPEISAAGLSGRAPAFRQVGAHNGGKHQRTAGQFGGGVYQASLLLSMLVSSSLPMPVTVSPPVIW